MSGTARLSHSARHRRMHNGMRSAVYCVSILHHGKRIQVKRSGVTGSVSLLLATSTKTAHRGQGRSNIRQRGRRKQGDSQVNMVSQVLLLSFPWSERDFLCQPQFPSSEERKAGEAGKLLAPVTSHDMKS